MSKAESRLPTFRDHYDLIIVGGGIYGATLAWEASSRGLSVALLEKQDFAGATSANSLKMIHGGIRYLQTLNISRIRESVRERRALLRIAPHLVSPLACVMPTYSQLEKSRLALFAGMKVYDALALGRNRGLPAAQHIPPGNLLSLAELRDILPGLSDTAITGGARWHDAQVYSTERLVLAFLLSAAGSGAHVCNYVAVRELVQDSGRVRGVTVEDVTSQQLFSLTGDVVVDCSGPWSWMSSQTAAPPPRMARAVNLLVQRRIAPCAVGVKTHVKEAAGNANRLLFVSPWRDGSLLGTWYFPDDAESERPELNEEELQICLQQTNSALPALNLQREDIVQIHLGRLPASESSPTTGEPVPDHQFRIVCAADQGGARGLFGVQGVKYTTARDVAMRVLAAAKAQWSRPLAASKTHETPLYGGDMADPATFLAQCRRDYSPQISPQTIDRLVKNYGTVVHDIVRYAHERPVLAELVPGSTDTIKAELQYVIDREMVCTLSDLVLRRTDLGSLAMPPDETIDYCATVLAEQQGWSNTQKAANVRELLAQYPAWVRRKAHPASLIPETPE